MYAFSAHMTHVDEMHSTKSSGGDGDDEDPKQNW